jgi:hypothetical protein
VLLPGVRPVYAEDVPAKQPSEASVTLNALEQAFVDRMTDAVLVGHFTVDGRRDKEPKAERYVIKGVKKLGRDRWVITAQMTYREIDIPLPVPVNIFWADDTPVLSLTDLTIPGLGKGFTTRLLFYENHYAGVWYHGEASGHMWGVIEKEARE